MWKIILSVFVLSLSVNVSPQFLNPFGPFRQMADYLNNVTVNDLANVLRWIPIPNPILFDGFPVGPNDVMFHLYTRRNPNFPEILKLTSSRISNLNPNNDIKFIVHGWIEDANRTYVRGLVDAFLERGDLNVIAVNWARPAATEYTIAARNTKTAGRALGDFMIRMTKIAGTSLKQMHILGHSLGAHFAGFAGKRVIQRTGQKVARITALDAAGPLFEVPIPVRAFNRLDKRDADFVDCIHTDGGIFGMTAAFCDADFYPNGGVPRQPGCEMLNIRDLSSRVIIDDLFCSHYKSHEYYRETINSNKMLSTNCESYERYRVGFCRGRPVVPMGEDTPSSTRGKYYLETNSAAPFAKS